MTLINKNLINNNNIKILLIVKSEEFYELDNLEEPIKNDVYILTYTDNLQMIDAQKKMFNSIKILKFHCFKNLQIKFYYFSRFKETQFKQFEKELNNFLVTYKMNYISDDYTIDQKMKDFIEKYKSDKFRFFNYDDNNRTSYADPNNSIQLLNDDDKKKITIMNLSFHFTNNMKSVLNNIQSFSNLLELNITINKKSEWFFNNHKKILKNLKNISSLSIVINEQDGVIELVDNVTKICENLNKIEFLFFLEDYNKKTIEKIIDLLLEKKKGKKFFKKLNYILIKNNSNIGIYLKLRELNGKYYREFFENYPQIILCFDNKYNEIIEYSKLNI